MVGTETDPGALCGGELSGGIRSPSSVSRYRNRAHHHPEKVHPVTLVAFDDLIGRILWRSRSNH